MRTLIDNIGQLVAVPPGPVCGEAMRAPPIIADASLVVDDERIAWFGRASDRPGGKYDVTVSADGNVVTPGLIDCHTHAVFAGSREGEFVQRIAGASYIELHKAGGGIRNSVRALRSASVDELVAQSEPRLRRMLAAGATTVEIKTGYGLSPEEEIKTLYAIRRLAERLPMEIVPTFLGAHTVPPEFEGRADDYLDSITPDSLLQRVADEKLAEFADAYCEDGAFTLEQSRRFLTRCLDFGLVPKLHSDQISNMGGTRMAVQLGAASVDHLEKTSQADFDALREAVLRYESARSTGLPVHAADATSGADVSGPAPPTIPVLLPGCSFFLNSTPAPARRMIECGLPLAIATDLNPGSCMIESLGFVMSIAATTLRMTPLECLVACTANAAAALRRQDRLGAIAVGHQADLLILDISDVALWSYRVGVNPVRTILRHGRPVDMPPS